MPVAESPSYHGYDVTDYYRIEPDYGTNDDFKRFVAEAHRRGIRVLVDMVLNHASSEHPWFKAALADTASPYRAWYRFAPAGVGRDRGAPMTWHKSPVRDEYYYGVFWSGMPDLNYETPAVREEAKKVARFWIQRYGCGWVPARRDHAPDRRRQHCRLRRAPTRASATTRRTSAASKPDVVHGRRSVGADRLVMPYYPDQLTAHFAFELADSLVAAVREARAGGMLAATCGCRTRLPSQRWSPFLSNHDGTRTMTMFAATRVERSWPRRCCSPCRASVRLLRRRDRHGRRQA